MKRAAFVLGLAALLCMTALTGCGGEEESATTGSSSVPTSQSLSTKDSCAISTAALTAVVALVTKGKELEEVGQTVSSNYGNGVLTSACQLAVEKFINEPAAEVHLTLDDLQLEPMSLQASLDQIRQSLKSPPPEPASSSDPCFNYTEEFFQNLCLSGIISPPPS